MIGDQIRTLADRETMFQPLRWTIATAILFSRVFPGKGWTQDELDLFDLVEEVEGSFYDLMQIDQVPMHVKHL